MTREELLNFLGYRDSPEPFNNTLPGDPCYASPLPGVVVETTVLDTAQFLQSEDGERTNLLWVLREGEFVIACGEFDPAKNWVTTKVTASTAFFGHNTPGESMECALSLAKAYASTRVAPKKDRKRAAKKVLALCREKGTEPCARVYVKRRGKTFGAWRRQQAKWIKANLRRILTPVDL